MPRVELDTRGFCLDEIRDSAALLAINWVKGVAVEG